MEHGHVRGLIHIDRNYFMLGKTLPFFACHPLSCAPLSLRCFKIPRLGSINDPTTARVQTLLSQKGSIEIKQTRDYLFRLGLHIATWYCLVSKGKQNIVVTDHIIHRCLRLCPGDRLNLASSLTCFLEVSHPLTAGHFVDVYLSFFLDSFRLLFELVNEGII